MSGIDKIINKIEDDTTAVCDEMISAAKIKADEIIADAQAEAEKIRRDAEENSVARIAEIEKRGLSAAELEEKKTLLSTKQSIISDMLGIAIENIKALPDDAYFKLILSMVDKYSQPRNGEIRFGKRDISRMSKGFIDEINTVAKGKLAMSDTAADIDAGFILIYGGIEENCSFDAIFMSESDNLKDKAGRLLF